MDGRHRHSRLSPFGYFLIIEGHDRPPAGDAHASNFRSGEGLHEVEAIKQLKARYCRHLDAKDWDAWRAIFADDFLSDTSESGGDVIAGADSFRRVHARTYREGLSTHGAPGACS